MALPSLFKTPRPKAFNYVPVYYNQEKEEFEERIKKAEQEAKAKMDKLEYKPSIKRGDMRGYFKSATQQKRSSNIRLIVILMALLIAAYFIISKM